MAYANSIEGGNKLIANIGGLKFYGQHRHAISRLQQTVMPGENTIKVQTHLDWKAGEWITIATNTMRTEDTEYAQIKSYNELTGELVVEENLQFYHWGDSHLDPNGNSDCHKSS